MHEKSEKREGKKKKGRKREKRTSRSFSMYEEERRSGQSWIVTDSCPFSRVSYLRI